MRNTPIYRGSHQQHNYIQMHFLCPVRSADMITFFSLSGLNSAGSIVLINRNILWCNFKLLLNINAYNMFNRLKAARIYSYMTTIVPRWQKDHKALRNFVPADKWRRIEGALSHQLNSVLDRLLRGCRWRALFFCETRRGVLCVKQYPIMFYTLKKGRPEGRPFFAYLLLLSFLRV